MGLLNDLMKKTKKIDFLFPNDFEQLMNDEYYDYDKFEWFLYYVFELEGCQVDKTGTKGKGDGGVDLILNVSQENDSLKRIGIQAKYWKNRVGVQPINQLASAKTTHHLTDLWLITTSDLTTDAKRITEQMNINVLRQDDVVKLIEFVKKKYTEQLESDGESPIVFLNSPIKGAVQNAEINKTNENEEKLIKFRHETSKKYKLFPAYKVFNNKMMIELLEKKPITIDELSKINGFGPKRVEQFGQELVDFVKKSLINNGEGTVDAQLYDLLISMRSKIAKYNKLSEDEVYTDKVAANIVKMKPQNLNTLKRVYGFREENIHIFGEYLIKMIKKILDSNV